ncbi:MAG TPA: NAD(P)-dependent oxidoreductase [Solirubrobacterales bacterium]|nr:NAD(P)-dependent oxidoreductase [Solirubrobacterales bacterium]
MRVAVAGATGVLGRATMPALRAAGHEARGFARDPAGNEDVVALDLLDRDAVVAFAREWRPEAIVHLATAIPEQPGRDVAAAFALTNRLRTEGTRTLVDAAAAAGGARLVSQSIAFVSVAGEGPADEDVPLRDDPGDPLTGAAMPIAELERLTLDAGGTVLRFGQLYGPGTMFAPDGAIGRMAARGRMPILHRHGHSSTFSFVHADDAAAAVLAALATGTSGVFNVVDDDPATVDEWLPALAAARGGPKPRRLPAWLARPMAGAYGIAFMTDLRGATNAKAKAELGWRPQVPSWRDGFGAG